MALNNTHHEKESIVTPNMQAIDHAHIFVKNRGSSESWYRENLGLSRVKEFEFWASNGGPLTIANEGNSIHLALFESEINQRTVIAFSTSGNEYIKWFSHLISKGLPVVHTDH